MDFFPVDTVVKESNDENSYAYVVAQQAIINLLDQVIYDEELAGDTINEFWRAIHQITQGIIESLNNDHPLH